MASALLLLAHSRQNFVKNCRPPPWRDGSSSATPAGPDKATRPDLCSPVSVRDLLQEQQAFVLVCLLEAGLVRALTMLTTSGERVRAQRPIGGSLPVHRDAVFAHAVAC